MAKKETIHVPARQLQVVRSNRTGLVNDLLPNETGWSEEDKALFYKTAGGDVLPIGDSPVVVIPGGTKRSKIMALVAAGKIPVVKMIQGQGDKYMYPAWTGSDKLRFSSTVFTGDSNVSGYWWADVPRSDDASWTYGYTALDLKDGAVTTEKIADGAVTTAKIVDANVTADKLATDSVTTAKITDANVTTGKIADSAVTTAKIADGAVTTAKIADGAVTTAKISDGTVTSKKIAPEAIGATRLATDSVQTDKILAAAVTTAKIADGAVTTAKILDGAVTTAKIVDANVTADKLATDSVQTDKILAAAVTTAKIADEAVTTAKILDGAVTTAKIVDANVTADKLATDSVQTDKILAAAVTTAKIADEAVTNAKISDGTVTEEKLDFTLINSRMPYKYLNGVNIVSLDDGNHVYTDCTIGNVITGDITERFTGTHIFRNCTIGVLDVIGLYDGHFEFINCSFSYIRVNATKCVFKNCVGDHIALVGDCSHSLIEGCTLNALLGKGCIVINGANAAQNITIRNCRLTNKQDPATLTDSTDKTCINSHGIADSVFENNFCECYNKDTNAIEVSGHANSDIFRSLNNVVRNNFIKTGSIIIFGSKDAIVEGNVCDLIKLDGGFRTLDYGDWFIADNHVRYEITFRASSGTPSSLKIVITNNVIFHESGSNGCLTAAYDFDADKIKVYFVNNICKGRSVNPSYINKVIMPQMMRILAPGESLWLPPIYCSVSELSDLASDTVYTSNQTVTNNTAQNKKIIYSFLDRINTTGDRLWQQ